MFIESLGEITTLLFMAFALSMDSFSVSLGIGIQNIRLKRIAMIGLVFGIFHVMLPLIGFVIGKFISFKLEYVTSFISGVILVLIGLYMIFSALEIKRYFIVNPQGFQLLSIAFVISLDSFPIGVSIGLSGIKTILAILLFGITAMFFAWIGMLIGRKVHALVGTYSEMLGGIILLLFGLSAVFN